MPRPAKQPKFSISVIAHNKLDLNKRCVESVFKHSKSFELLLTDNASTDGTKEFFDSLAKESKNIRVFHNEKNLGFSEPNNRALAEAKGEYFVTLNNDAEVSTDWLRQLEQPFKDFPTAAISGPSGSCCSFQHPYPSFHGSPGANFEYVEGSCLCIPAKLAREHTLFAPYLKFAYAEDCDLSLRMRAMGHTIHQVPFRLTHHRGATAKDMPGLLEIMKFNQRALIARWGNYHKFRRFDLPIVIRRREALGDVLLITPLLDALREQQPLSEIYVETDCPEVLKGYPSVTAGKEFPQVYKWARLIDLNMSYESMTKTHIVDAYFKTAMIIPAEKDYRRTTVNFTEEDKAFAEERIEGDKWVAVHPGPSTWPGKTWPEDRWRKLIMWLLDNRWRVVLVGSPGPAYGSYLDLRGHTTPQQLAAALSRCTLFIGLDSFPLHVAQSVDTPAIGLFGATSPEYILTNSKTTPIVGKAPCAGERHRVVGKTTMPCDGACMDSIKLEQVIAAI